LVVCCEKSILTAEQMPDADTCKVARPHRHREDLRPLARSWLRTSKLALAPCFPGPNYPRGTSVKSDAPVTAAMTAAFRKNDHAVKDVRIEVDATTPTDPRIQVHFTDNKDGKQRVLIDDDKYTSADHCYIPVVPGATIKENLQYMTLMGKNPIWLPGPDARKAMHIPDVPDCDNQFPHPCLTCLRMKLYNKKADGGFRAAPDAAKYVFFTTRGSIIMVSAEKPSEQETKAAKKEADEKNAPTLAMQITMRKALEAGDRLAKAWPVPGRSPSTMWNVCGWMKLMEKEHADLIAGPKLDEAFEAWKDVDVFAMIVGTRCPAEYAGGKKGEQPTSLGEVGSIMWYGLTAFKPSLCRHLIPLLYAMFAAALKAHGIQHR